MGHRNTLSGHIQEPYYVSGSDRLIRALLASNRHVIRSLPLDDEWPPLNRTLFSFATKNIYRGRVIHFGGSFSSIYVDWKEWLRKFEGLLRRLYWEHAAVVLITEWLGNHTFYWDATNPNNWTDDIRPEPVKEWRVTGDSQAFG